ncbi:MAG: hypothetical protein Q9214_005064 [Letrouitia sp. 1 TL-2023]
MRALNWPFSSKDFQKHVAAIREERMTFNLALTGDQISTIVHHLIDYCESKQDSKVGYFFFDFNDIEKQKSENLVRSLISQFLFKSPNVPEILSTLFSQSQSGSQQPSLGNLISALRKFLNWRSNIFLVFDALDECSDREQLLDLIETIIDWKLENVHILATSRKETDISEMLESLHTSPIPIQNNYVNADIQKYVSQKLKNDKKLKKWPEMVQSEIQETLMKGARGIKCLKAETLRNTLKSSPKDLDSTYARILCNIHELHKKDALTILLRLTISMRPLTIMEVAEATAINLEYSPRFDEVTKMDVYKYEYEDDGDVGDEDKDKDDNNDEDEMEDKWEYARNTGEIIRLAHFSVKEYLVSDRIRLGPAHYFQLDKDLHAEIACAYLVYLQDADIRLVNLSESPLAKYAAQYSCDHAKLTTKKKKTTNIFMDFFGNREAFIKSTRIYHPDKNYSLHSRNLPKTITPIYYTSVFGIIEVLRKLLCDAANPKVLSGLLGSPLQAASSARTVGTVQLLLDKGTDINFQGGYYGNAIQATCFNGNKEVVELLLDRGAEVNTQDRYHGNARRAACYMGNKEIVEILLDRVAEINTQGKEGTALQVACFEGRYEIVKLLLDRGADINTQGGYFGNALNDAISSGTLFSEDCERTKMVKLLLDQGANVNAQGGPCDTPLECAVWFGEIQAMQLLLDFGAEIDAPVGDYGTALQTACYSTTFGHHGYRTSLAIVKLLLDRGANVNAQAGIWGTALEAALASGKKQVAQLLIDWGADADSQALEQINDTSPESEIE